MVSVEVIILSNTRQTLLKYITIKGDQQSKEYWTSAGSAYSWLYDSTALIWYVLTYCSLFDIKLQYEAVRNHCSTFVDLHHSQSNIK